MKIPKALALGVFTLAFGVAASSTASADVHLTMQNGRVSLIAKDATLRQILAEWAKVGQTKIVNAERVPGGPLTLQFTNWPERQALDTLLRTLAGYVAQPREIDVANLSHFDRIVVMPTIAVPASGAAANVASPIFPQPGNPTFQQPVQTIDDQDDDRPAPNRGPMFNTFPPPQIGNPLQQNIPSAMPGIVNPQAPLMLPQPNAPMMPVQAPAQPKAAQPTAYPAGVSVPGMIVPAPPQPGQAGQPPKRPGGL
jgi:hypothetical protein